MSTRIREEISNVLTRGVKDPRLNNITITDVKMNRDLKKARVYYCLLGDESQKKDAENGLKSALGFMKREVASRLGLRYMPEIKFLFDESFDYSSKIDKIFDTINKKEYPGL
ncbi:MAG: 30S ribosome-binding factor RbfA [Candidatus Magnetomorum sp.]|nr:30S ribosome-binding factor RbfA [Candidatus Magnetomorum sp.]